MQPLQRSEIFPEGELPLGAALLLEGRGAANAITVGKSPFLEHYGVQSEAEYKRRCAAEGRLMFHAHIGFRDQAKTREAWARIYDAMENAGHRMDRFGLSFDWCMGYPQAQRRMPVHGTGLVLGDLDEWVALTHRAPVAPHFGDHTIGTPAAFENAALALQAGCTSIGNLGQYFMFRQPGWNDDVYTTAETVKALALTAAQPVEILVHSNIDDGFAALFSDLACSLGAVLIEQYIVEDLCGGHMSHCFGNTFSRALTRLAFQRAVQSVSRAPGTMIYGATTLYGENHAENFAGLGNYLRTDALGQRTRPSGHAITPVPVTEAQRIPDIGEIIDAHLFARRLCELEAPLESLHNLDEVDAVTATIVEGGKRFKENVLRGFADAGIDTADPFQMLLALRRIGPKRVEELYGPGETREGQPRRHPLVLAGSVEDVEEMGRKCVTKLSPELRDKVRRGRFRICVATTDVHEYGKILVEDVLHRLSTDVVDAGVSTLPKDVVARAQADGADAIAVSTYNGIALEYVTELKREMRRLGLVIPVFVGGRLNRIPDNSNTSLPVDVSKEIAEAGAIVCPDVAVMLERLAEMSRDRAA